jgi:hypothetical protein
LVIPSVGTRDSTVTNGDPFIIEGGAFVTRKMDFVVVRKNASESPKSMIACKPQAAASGELARLVI